VTFGSPWLLWGLALGAVPIVVHLLNRRRHVEMPWAAMRFLLEATRRNSRRIRLEQLILLAVRTLILLLLAFALARPFVAASGVLGTTEAGVHRIVVLDASYSMTAAGDGGSRFDAARRAVGDVVRDARQGDALNLLVMRSRGPRVLVGEPAFRHEEVLDELDRLEATHEPGDLPAVLRDVARLLKSVPEPRRKEVVFVGDLQRSDWSPAGNGARARLREAFDALGGDVPLTIVDVGGRASAANVAVTRIEVEAEGFVAVGVPLALRATLVHHGQDVRASHPVELYVDDRLRERRTVNLPAEGEATVDFAFALDDPGEHVVEVRSPPDVLPLDDVRRIVLRARETVNVLLVDGRPSGRFGESATSFLQVALAPSREGQPWRGLLQLRTIGEGELQDVDLARYDVVFVANVALLVDREADLLRRYVESGGGLVVSLGERVRLESYNHTLFRTDFTFDDVGLVPAGRSPEGGVLLRTVPPGSPAWRAGLRDGWFVGTVDGREVDSAAELQRAVEQGSLATGIPLTARSPEGVERAFVVRRPTLLPARLERVVTAPRDDEGFGFDAADLSHPIVRAFEGNPEAGLLTTRVPTYAAIDEASLGSARVALKFDTGDAAIVEHALGRGRCVLVTTSLDREWGGAWPGWPSFPQMMQELVAFAVSGRDAGLDLVVGDSFERTFAASAVDGGATIRRPDGDVEAVALAGRDGVAVAYDRTNRAGVYELRVPPPIGASEWFAVGLDPVEGNLARVEDRLLDELLTAVPHRVRDRWSGAASRRGESEAADQSVAVWLLTAVACLLLVETVMAWRFAPGFALLCGLIGLVLAGRVLPAVAVAAIAIALAIGAGAAVWLRSRTSERPQ
jgi:hypothetical protein